MTKVVHKLIAETAKGIAFEAYEILASDDRFYKRWPKPRPFVAKHWRDFIGHARASLIVMLAHRPGTEHHPNGPEYFYDQATRDAVYEAVTTEGAFKHVPQPMIPSAGEIARYGGLN